MPPGTAAAKPFKAAAAVWPSEEQEVFFRYHLKTLELFQTTAECRVRFLKLQVVEGGHWQSVDLATWPGSRPRESSANG